MTTPHCFSSLESALCALFGEGIKVETASRISGGDINEVYGLTLTDGKCIFMKANKKENGSLFTAEAAGLDAIAQTKTIGTPQILGVGTDEERGGFPPIFYDAYKEAAPLQPGYERRRDVYNLYHLLNHLNLFGRMYLPEVKHTISRTL